MTESELFYVLIWIDGQSYTHGRMLDDYSVVPTEYGWTDALQIATYLAERNETVSLQPLGGRLP